MKPSAYLLSAFVALLGAQNVAPVSAPAPPSVRAPKLTAVDDAFAVAATQGNDAELAAARLALERSHSGAVIAFARQMLVDHGMISAEGAPLLKRHLASPPAHLNAPDTLAMRYLGALPPVDFDQQYALLQIGDHLATQTAFATEARDGKDVALRAFAQKWLPTIGAHLELAVMLVKHVGGDTPFKQ